MTLLLILLIAINCLAQDGAIDISVKGISDSKNDGAQKDRQEAILDARRQACEKAGVTIESKTTVENFQTTFDQVQTRSEGILLPGYQIVDIGYVQDGTYNVVLTGKVKPANAVSSESAEFHIIIWLNEEKGFIPTKARLMDRLYDRFTSLHGS
ncbi:MAG: LPP20 family lipoprotein, partial [Fibrobacteres bacterium]|nr:LPP20 family lipoprotein [Fibrobacterota bacterium]